MFVVLEVDEQGTPVGDSVFTSLAAARLQRIELDLDAAIRETYAVFELTEVED